MEHKIEGNSTYVVVTDVVVVLMCSFFVTGWSKTRIIMEGIMGRKEKRENDAHHRRKAIYELPIRKPLQQPASA